MIIIPWWNLFHIDKSILCVGNDLNTELTKNSNILVT